MTDEQKIELLKGKLTDIIKASIQQDPKADVLFLSLFNAVKDNDALFAGLADQAKVDSQNEITQLQATISDREAKIAELDALPVAADTVQAIKA